MCLDVTQILSGAAEATPGSYFNFYQKASEKCTKLRFAGGLRTQAAENNTG